MTENNFNVIPAIDLKAGRCVRLYQGKREQETKYSDNPTGVARRWEELGARRLHIVDLDGAFEEETKNQAVIKEIIAELSIPCQVGGGLRSREALAELFEAGAAAGIVGTAGIKEPDWLGEMVGEFGADKIYAGVDCDAGEVMVSGWREGASLQRDRWLEKLENIGVKTIIYTDISRDGTEEGPNLAAVQEVLESFNLNVIASGGVGCLEDVRRLQALNHPRLLGVITGKALYEGNLDLAKALAI